MKPPFLHDKAWSVVKLVPHSQVSGKRFKLHPYRNLLIRHNETLNRFPVIVMFRNYSRCTYMFHFETFKSLSVVKFTPCGTILGRLSFNVSIAVSRSSNRS